MMISEQEWIDVLGAEVKGDFVFETFKPSAAMVKRELVNGLRMWRPYDLETFNEEEYELVPDMWDHEHCVICWEKIQSGGRVLDEWRQPYSLPGVSRGVFEEGLVWRGMTANQRAVVVGVGLVVVLLVLSWLKLTGRMEDLAFGPDSPFSEGRWKGRDLRYRHHALPEVMAHRVWPGMTEREVRAVLGDPDIVADSRWQYEVLRSGGRAAAGFQGGGLVITFSKERTVEKVADLPVPL